MVLPDAAASKLRRRPSNNKKQQPQNYATVVWFVASFVIASLVLQVLSSDNNNKIKQIVVSSVATVLASSSSSSSPQQRREEEEESRPSTKSSSWHDDIEDFLSNFTAAGNPEWTEQCKAYLRSPSSFNKERESFINWKWRFSQYNQDWFILVNFFLDHVRTGYRGTYVTSGSNDWIRVSNTAFMDLCLGWTGLCIEPSRTYHDAITKFRSCKLIKHCLSNQNETVYFQREEGSSIQQAANNGIPSTQATCMRLDELLRNENMNTVDVWSLDVEGFEHKVLSGMDFSSGDITIHSILMEQQELSSGVCSQFPIDYRLTTLGYRRYRIVSDGYYIKGSKFLQERYPTLQFPNVTDLDRWFVELEATRCKSKQAELLPFFAPPPDN